MVRAPQHLSKPRRALYRRLVEDYGLDREPHALETLRLACEQLDRAAEARERINADGPYVEDRFGQLKSHPAISVEKDATTLALRALRELALDGAVTEGDVRPPRLR